MLIKSGVLIDPAQEIEEKYDVAVSKGTVEAVEKNIPASSAKNVIDASGMIVTPGIIDLHVHVCYSICPKLGVIPDKTCLSTGATTVLDAGSAGHITFPSFREFIIKNSKTKIYALLNIGSIGLVTFFYDKIKSILLSPELIDPSETVSCIEKNRDVIKGIKWHHVYGQEALLLARQVADKTGTFLMCENSALYWYPIDVVLKFMKKGDVLTHCFHGGPAPAVVDEDGRIRPEVEEAYRRGVVFDVGHGQASFSFSIAEKAIQEGLLPTTISTDLHLGNINGPVYDVGTTLSKFLVLGLSLTDVVRRATINPARVLNIHDKLGNLKPGATADIVVWKMMEGRFEFVDCVGEKRTGSNLLRPIHIITNGELLER
ncbi:MAG: amidohydrolase/deacetylase family metallohydrolase [Nitrososphaerota archaeon]